MDSAFKFIKVGLKSSGEINANSRNNVKSMEEFMLLLQHIDKTLQNIGAEILDGEVGVKPFELVGNKACTYCSFKALCQFDEMLDLYEYNKLPKLENDNIMAILNGGEK